MIIHDPDWDNSLEEPGFPMSDAFVIDDTRLYPGDFIPVPPRGRREYVPICEPFFIIVANPSGFEQCESIHIVARGSFCLTFTRGKVNFDEFRLQCGNLLRKLDVTPRVAYYSFLIDLHLCRMKSFMFTDCEDDD